MRILDWLKQRLKLNTQKVVTSEVGDPALKVVWLRTGRYSGWDDEKILGLWNSPQLKNMPFHIRLDLHGELLFRGLPLSGIDPVYRGDLGPTDIVDKYDLEEDESWPS